jgi:hypothetical protein
MFLELKGINTKPVEYYTNEKGCWICTSHARGGNGYPQVGVNRKITTIARVLLKQKYRDFSSNVHVLHRCDDKGCINPEHLYIGTNKDNMNDRRERCRLPSCKGENNANSFITHEDVELIRHLYSETVTSHRQLATQFGISKTQITRILNNKQWKDGD